jgi:predicted AAA+ superfamily ATPase
MPVDVEYRRTDLLDIYRGAVAEQFVGQELSLSQHEEVYYWSRPAKSSSAEVDYVAAINGKIYPLEVKSGASGSLKSLHLFLKTYSRTPGGMVFSTRPYEELPEKNITFIPLYFAYSATGGADIL